MKIQVVSTLLSPSETINIKPEMVRMVGVSTLLSPSETLDMDIHSIIDIDGFHTIKSF